MNRMVGADPDALDRVAREFDDAASKLRTARKFLTSGLHASPWNGRSADRFLQQWQSEHSLSLAGTANYLSDAAARLRANAEDQRRVSAEGNGSSGRFEQCRVTFGTREDATRSRMEAELADMKRRRATIGNGWLQDRVDGLPGQSERERLDKEIKRLETMLAGHPPRKFLAYSSNPTDNRITEVYGDLSSAEHVIIHIPGIRTNLDHYTNGNGDALNIYNEAVKLYGPNVAVVSFANYDIPGSFDAMSSAGADSGVPNLQGLVADLHAEGKETKNISVVAHSYGTLVTGHAMRDGSGLDVGRVVALGSPGMGESSRGALGSPDVELYSGSAPIDVTRLKPWEQIDPVSQTSWYGLDPTRDSFGAQSVNVPDAYGHSRYFSPRSQSLHNIVVTAVNGS